MAQKFKLNETVITLAEKHFSQGNFGPQTLADAIGVHFTTVYSWLRQGQAALEKPPEERNSRESLCARLAELHADPPQVYTAAWQAILANLNSNDPDLDLAWKVITHFDEGHLAKMELAIAQHDKEAE